METEKHTHGGSRPGSGRPRLFVKRIYITLTPDQIAWLRSQGNASLVIRGLITQAMGGGQE